MMRNQVIGAGRPTFPIRATFGASRIISCLGTPPSRHDLVFQFQAVRVNHTQLQTNRPKGRVGLNALLTTLPGVRTNGGRGGWDEDGGSNEEDTQAIACMYPT